jgi:hypothetical protein
MRLAVAFCLTIAAAIVESRPSTVPAGSSKVSYQSTGCEHNSQANNYHPQLNVKQSIDSSIEARGLGDALHNALNKDSSSSDTSTTSPVTTSSSSETANSRFSPFSPGSLLSGSQDAKAETYGDDKITTYHSLGTTRDRVGFSWVPVDSTD